MGVADWIRNIREKGLENASSRYYSDYPGEVVEDGDPQQQGRVRVWMKQLGFNAAHPNFAYPVSPYAGENYGFYFPPHKDQPVYVRFDHGDANIPRVVGSWWQNPGSNPRARKVSREPEYSHIPAEFRKEAETGADGKPKMPSTTARGIKTKGGHGLIFEDAVDEQHVELWTGRNQPAGALATRRHRVRLDDTKDAEEIVITTLGGHKTTWRDATGEIYIKTTTKDGHELLLDDTNKKIVVRTKDGYQVLLDDQNQKLEARTKDGHSLLMSDLDLKVETRTKDGHSVLLDDQNQKIEVLSKALRQLLLDDKLLTTILRNKTGQDLVMDEAGCTVTEPKALSLLAGELAKLVGKGITLEAIGGGLFKIQASGNAEVGVTGDMVQQAGGTLTQQSTGEMALVAPTTKIQSSSVQVGTGTQFFLVTEQFLAQYLVHTHITTAPGAPSSPPVTGIALVPGVTSTLQLRAS